jgi:hypothetical protein
MGSTGFGCPPNIDQLIPGFAMSTTNLAIACLSGLVIFVAYTLMSRITLNERTWLGYRNPKSGLPA